MNEQTQTIIIFALALVMIALFLLIYFLPSIIAFNAKRKNALAILILNLFLGWTFLGWVGALVWALVKD